MSEVIIKGRYVQKHDIEANWIKAAQADNPFIPKLGELIIYDPEVDSEGNILELPEGRAYPYTYSRSKIGDGFTNVDQLPFNVHSELLKDVSDFDLVITSEENFRECLYMLHPNKNEDGSIDLTTKGEANPDFDYSYILVRNVDFTEDLGTSDLDLAIFQPSVHYVRFDNCQWHCQWWISGEEPTEFNNIEKPTEYKRASGEFNVILDGINITEQNVIDSIPTEDDPDRYYYIGLRNFERIENCFIHYPSNYALVEEFNEDGTSAGFRYTFKFNLQYFNTIQNCKATALWDGSNISGCRVSERIVRCNNCTNIIAEPIYRGGELYRVQMRESSNLSNIYGTPIIYTNCSSIDSDTCSEYDAPKASEADEFDLIITSMADMAALPSNTTAKNVLVTGFTLSSKTAVPGFFDNTVSESNEPYFVKFVVPKNVKYLKFSKSFYYTLARVVIQGHPDCIIDGLPTITAPYNYTQCTALYDFKEVRNCYARGTSTYDENDSLVENFTTVGISNVLVQVPNANKYPALAPSYNYQKTRFVNCDLSYIDYAESVTNSRIITNIKIGYSPYIKNASIINGLKIVSIAASQTLTLQNCSHVSNVNSNGYNIAYDSCSKIDTDTCDNVPEELIMYATKDFVNESITDFVSVSKLKSSIEYDLIISSVDEFKALESNTTAKNILVQNFGVYRANHVNGFFDNSASDYMYWTKFRIPTNVKYIKFNNFKQQNSRVVIQGHEDCIIDGFPTVTSPYTADKLYGNCVVLYNFKEARNCCCTNIHQIDADGNYTFDPGVNGISNVILDMPYPTEEYSITISGEKVSIDTTNLAPDRVEQKTKFVNCDLLFINGASSIENCRVHMGKLMTDYVGKLSVPAIANVDLISGLTVQNIASNKSLLVKSCKNIFGVNENGYTADYVDCSNISASQAYVDEAAANSGKIKDVVAASNSGLKVTTSEGVATIDWDEEVVFVFDGGGLEEEFIKKYSEGLDFTSNGDGTCYVSGIGTCADLDLIIPPTSPNGDSVTSIGSSALSYCTSFTSVVIPDSVTNIGNYAFYRCSSLTSVTIPDSVTSIGDYVFSDCSSLESITLPFVGDSRKTASDTYQYPFGYIFGTSSYTGGVATKQYYYGSSTSSTTYVTYYIPSSLKSVTITGGNILYGAFYGCTGLTNVTIGDGVESIGERAFYNCDSLTSVVIPDSVTSIGRSAFQDCTSLTSVTIPDSVISIDSYAFNYCSSLTSVHISDIMAWCNISFGDSYSNPLYYARNLYIGGTLVEELIIPDSVTSIGDRAFYNCTSLTNITIGDNVESIGSYAFNGCESITSVTIPNSVTSIDSYAFQTCTSLTSVMLGDSVESIGKNAFSSCSSLTSVYITDIAKWCGILFGNNYSNPLFYAKNLYLNGELVTNLVIPEDVTSIGDRAFYNCTSFTSVTIGDGVESIGEQAFYGCSNLATVVIGDSVTSIGEQAFHNCSNLTSVHISDVAAWCNISFNNYSSNPLYYAHNIYLNGELVTELVIPDGVISISEQAFYNCTSLTSVVIPDSVTSISSYAFYGCTSLISVTIPDSVTSIRERAFQNCSSLAIITYSGTAEQWNSISFGTNWKYGIAATYVQCTDGTVTL